MKFLYIFLIFVTLWVVIICVVAYLGNRRPGVTPPRAPDADRPAGTCCLAVPCSSNCARIHQQARDDLGIKYGNVVREIGLIIQAGQDRELEHAAEYPAGLDGGE